MRTHMASLIGGVLIGLATVTATNGLLPQESTAAAGGVPMAGQAVLPQAATPAADDVAMADKMDRMMDQCLAMMEMMSAMMGGDMAGMMSGEGMEGMAVMADMPQAAGTPEP